MATTEGKKPQTPEDKYRALVAKRDRVGLPVGHDQLIKLLRSRERKGEAQR
jgi:hypothetical protein